jgi:hypothetical protein
LCAACCARKGSQVAENGYRIVLVALVGLLKEQGLAGAGKMEGLNAYQALSEVAAQAEAYGVPLEDIGLAGFNIDSILSPPQKAA